MISFVWKRLARRKLWEPIFRPLFLMASGAYLLVGYLAARMPQPESLEAVMDRVQVAWLILLIA